MEGHKKDIILSYRFSVVIFFVITLFSFFSITRIVYARTNIYAPGTVISTPTTWTKSAGPYVISGLGSILVVSTLTIEPGTVIMFSPNHYLQRYNGILVSGGSIIANGTEDEPIVFTSYLDDTVIGDVNGNGSATSPSPGDWRGIVLAGDLSELSHVEIRYSANMYQSYGALETKSGSLASLSDVVIKYNQTSGVRLNEPNSSSFERVTISDSGDYGIYSTIAGSDIVFVDSSILNSADGIANLSAGNTVKFENLSLSGNFAAIFISGNDIANNAVWPRLGNAPYIFDNQITIASGSILSLEPGVVVKGEYGQYPDSRFKVLGRLLAKGTQEAPIIFTSMRDDTVGGDTNRDSSATSPAPGDWGGLYFENSSGSVLENVTIRYGGEFYGDFNGSYYLTTDFNMVHAKNSSLSISNCTIENADSVGIYLEGASELAMYDSKVNNNQTGILSSSSLGSVISNSSFENNSLYAINNSLAQIDARNNWWGHNSGPYHISNPQGEGQKIFGDVLFDPWIGRIDPVILIPGILGSWNFTGSWELDPILNTYDNLWEALKNAGYQEGVDLFVFPYNWRVDNAETAQLLKNKIDEVQNITGKNKVDVIGYSMGGLIARYYIENELFLEDSDGLNNIDVDQVIFLATPHLGSTKSYLTWEGGELGVKFPSDWVMKKVFSVEADFNGYADVFDYVHNMPILSVKQLLPIYDYLRDKDTGIIREYPDNYPVNEFLEELNTEEKLNKMNLVRGLNIIGKMGNDSTIDVLRVEDKDFVFGEWEHGYPENFNDVFFGGDHGLEYSEGDETVSNRSNNNFANFPTEVLNFDHTSIVTEAQKIIINELTGIMPDEMVRKNIFKKWLFIREHSPVDLQIIAPDGKKIGKDFETGQILNEIDGAFYSGYENVGEFVLIPEPSQGVYKILTQGLSNGTFGLSVGYFDQDFGKQVENSWLDIPTQENKIDEFNLNLSSAQNGEIELDFEFVADFNILKQTIDMCYELGWFKNEGTKISLLELVDVAERLYNKYEAFTQTNSEVADILKQNLIRELENIQNKIFENALVSEQASVLLLKQIEYIINNL